MQSINQRDKIRIIAAVWGMSYDLKSLFPCLGKEEIIIKDLQKGPFLMTAPEF